MEKFQWRRFGSYFLTDFFEMMSLKHTFLHRIEIFFQKKVCGDISMSRRTCWRKEFVSKCHPTELSVKYRDFVWNWFLCGIVSPSGKQHTPTPIDGAFGHPSLHTAPQNKSPQIVPKITIFLCSWTKRRFRFSHWLPLLSHSLCYGPYIH